MSWTERYSNFPSEIDSFIEHYDIQYEDLSDVRRYQELKGLSYLTEVQQQELNTLTTKLIDKLWFSEDLNKITATLVNLEIFFRDNTVAQLDAYKDELATFAADYEKLTYLMYQSWVTTTSKDYDIHSGNEVLDPIAEITVDASANIELTLDGVGVPYNKYTIVTNTSQKKTIIRFNSDYAITAGKRLEAKWQDTSGKVYSVSGHTHPVNQITGLASIATSGSYSDLSGVPTQFNPSTHGHAWGEITGKPSTFPVASHTHDDRYFTETEITTKLSGKSDTGHKHAIADVTGLQGEIDSLKQSVSSGKTSIASAITAKGVSATGSDSFDVLASKVGQIQKISDPFTVYNKIAVDIASQWNGDSPRPPGMKADTVTVGVDKTLTKGFFHVYTDSPTGYAYLSGDYTTIKTSRYYSLYRINTTAIVKTYIPSGQSVSSKSYSYISEADIIAYLS